MALTDGPVRLVSTVADRREGGTGTDTLICIEILNFTDADLNLHWQTGITRIEAADLDSFVELYIAYFNRALDAQGLGFWTGVLDSGSLTRDQFILEVLGGAKADPPADAIDGFYIDALDADTGAFIVQVIDVLDDPFMMV